jgi:hypothetical protein
MHQAAAVSRGYWQRIYIPMWAERGLMMLLTSQIDVKTDSSFGCAYAEHEAEKMFIDIRYVRQTLSARPEACTVE